MAKRPAIRVDIASTRRRTQQLRRYVAGHLLDGKNDFICPHFRECKASRQKGDTFREGTMSHLGRRFDLSFDGKPLRIVIVGQESGWAKMPAFRHGVSLDDRYWVVHDRSGLERRYYAEPGHEARNPHMRGTTSALRLLLGTGLGSDYAGELIKPANGRPFHVFDGFALVNRLLCSAGPHGSSEGHPTRTMFTNCAEHFVRTMEILEPTIVIFQGQRVAKRTRQLFGNVRRRTDQLSEGVLKGNRVILCEFSHPSARGALRWGDRVDAPYLTRVVAPTLGEARQIL
jgi:hypothetical protein